MTVRPLFTIGALAGEIGVDRTVLSVALSEIEPDGHRSGRPVYRVGTALAALDLRSRRDRRTPPKAKSPTRTVSHPDGLVGVFLARLNEPGTHRDLAAPLLTVSQAAEVYAVPEQTIITWLWAGAPVAQAGDPLTGEGVLLILVFDFTPAIDIIYCIAALTPRSLGRNLYSR